MQERIPLYQRPFHLKHLLHCILEESIRRQNNTESTFECFNSNGKLALNMLGYIQRLILSFHCSKSNFVILLIFLDRVSNRKGFRLTRKNIYKVFAISLTIATKMYDDHYRMNKYYAICAGITLQHFNQLQHIFLHQILQFDTFVTPDYFQEYCENLQRFYTEHEEHLLPMIQRDVQEYKKYLEKMQQQKAKQLERRKIIQRNYKRYNILRRRRKAYLRKIKVKI